MLRNIIRFAVRKVASDPRVRAKAKETARKIAKGAGELAREPEPARSMEGKTEVESPKVRRSERLAEKKERE